ncbi:MAG: DUF6499 domain-containing protein [Acetobacter sp.]|uniref:transcriptional regulator domain-containing protein n=1 Tax=Acetobacteraceae TaxID=433 RepID=UPI002226DDC2|nr:DUF6499 domain-containing protein [Gluconobacter cerinus]MCW2264263.1 hypothetical protein [Gluconobacter cerinus]
MPIDIWQSETDLVALKRLDDAGLAGAFMRRWRSYRDDYAETFSLVAAGGPDPGGEWDVFCQRWRLRFPA